MYPLKHTPITKEQITYPCWVTFKPSNCRCFIYQGVAYDADMVPWGNLELQQTLKELPDGLDGYLVNPIHHKTAEQDYRDPDGLEDFLFYVMDTAENPTWPHIERIDWSTGYRDMVTWYCDTMYNSKCLWPAYRQLVSNIVELDIVMKEAKVNTVYKELLIVNPKSAYINKNDMVNTVNTISLYSDTPYPYKQ